MLFEKKEKVTGEIIRFSERNNKHYPVFSFTTKDGKKIEQEVIKDSPLEDVIKEEWILDFLEKPLPITDVEIVYKKNNPTDFYARYL